MRRIIFGYMGRGAVTPQPRERKMINTLKFVFIAAVALAGIASPAFAQTEAHHRHGYAPEAVYNHRSDAAFAPALNPADDPATTGGGSVGYNACTGHARC